MGFLNSLMNLFGEKCPACGTPGAKKVDNRVFCLNPLCQNFDPARGQGQSPPQQPVAPAIPSTPQGFSSRPSSGTVAIWYRNYKGESRTFTADAASLQRKRNHITAKVAPKGRVIALSRDRIQNLHEIDPLLPARDRSDAPQPTGRERQVLAYHKKYGTTSPLHEKIKAKYPGW